MTTKEIIKARVQEKVNAARRLATHADTREKTRLECWQRAIEKPLAELLDRGEKGND